MGCASHAGTASCCVHGAWCWGPTFPAGAGAACCMLMFACRSLLQCRMGCVLAAVRIVLGPKSCRWLSCMPALKLPVRRVLCVMTACATDVRKGLPCQLAGVGVTRVEGVCCVNRWSPVSLRAPLPLLLAGRTAVCATAAKGQ